jgi:hyperosmotically inducible periplasmic protein
MRRLLVAAVLTFGVAPYAFPQSENASKVSSADDRIQYQVRLRLANDPDVKGGADEVTVADGVVTIKGRVDTEKGKTKATKLAKKVKGVKDVNNQLAVGPPS